MRRRNVFWIGLDEFHLRKLRAGRHAATCDFHGLLEPDELLRADRFPVEEMLARIEGQLRAFPGPVDALLGYMDFPVSTMLPILCARRGLRSASLSALLRCEHKYWSRLEQRRLVPECVPDFVAFDPLRPDARQRIGLPFPFWVKPVKSAGSHLGFRVEDEAGLETALAAIRAGIERYGDPFDRILARVDLPEEVARVGGRFCLAETIVAGRQCTVEGSVRAGRLSVHGVVDSVRYPRRTSFLRYEYPSRLPRRVQERMRSVCERFLHGIGYDDAAFNAEFFWDERSGRIWLLEVNTRIAQHHADLFEKVDGASNHEVTLDVALGDGERFPRRQGPFACAATCFLRRFRDAEVLEVPGPEAIARVERAHPGARVELAVAPGMRLSQLHDQDSYSYAYAILYLGAASPRELRRRFLACREALPFGFRDAQQEAA